MQDDYHEKTLPLDQQVWRLAERQRDVLKRLDKIEIRLDHIVNRQEERSWALSDLERRIIRLEKPRDDNGNSTGARTSLFSDNAFVRTILLGLLAAVIGLATGQIVGFP